MINDHAEPAQEKEYQFLRSQLYWLCWTLQDYKKLFSSEESFELMCRVVGSLASVIRLSMLDGIQLDICALTDPSNSRGGNNLSLRRLLDLCTVSDQSDERFDSLMEKLDKADEASSRMRLRRNKLIAHFDSTTILNKDHPLIEWPSLDEMEGLCSS